MRHRIPSLLPPAILLAMLLAASALTHPFTSVAAASGAPGSSASNSDAKARGAELFATRGCVHCHGPAGVGGGLGPDLQQVRKRLKAPQMSTQIQDGGKGMPSYGDLLTPGELSDLIDYLRANRKFIVAAPPQLAPPSTEPDERPDAGVLRTLEASRGSYVGRN